MSESTIYLSIRRIKKCRKIKKKGESINGMLFQQQPILRKGQGLFLSVFTFVLIVFYNKINCHS